MKALVSQSCLTLCDLMDQSPPGSSVHGILQARIPAWVATSSSKGSSPPKNQTPDLLHCRWILYHLIFTILCHLIHHHLYHSSLPEKPIKKKKKLGNKCQEDAKIVQDKNPKTTPLNSRNSFNTISQFQRHVLMHIIAYI